VPVKYALVGKCINGKKRKVSQDLGIPLQVDVSLLYEGWNFNSGSYLFTTDTK